MTPYLYSCGSLQIVLWSWRVTYSSPKQGSSARLLEWRSAHHSYPFVSNQPGLPPLRFQPAINAVECSRLVADDMSRRVNSTCLTCSHQPSKLGVAVGWDLVPVLFPVGTEYICIGLSAYMNTAGAQDVYSVRDVEGGEEELRSLRDQTVWRPGVGSRPPLVK